MIQLFLLNPDFTDQKADNKGKLYYCPDCAIIEGILSYYPELKKELDIVYVDFETPRTAIVALIGEENQGSPVVIISKEETHNVDVSYFTAYGDVLFINSTSLIAKFLSEKYNVGLMHP